MIRRALPGLVLAALLSAGIPTDAGAQEATVRAGTRGWIGISYTVTMERELGPPDTRMASHVVLTRVYEGSPAAEVGLEAGDTILSVNGVPASEALFRNLDLEPGDRVSMTVRQGDRTEELTLTAAHRPETVALFQVSPEQRIRIDSVQSAIVRFMEDSARVRLRSVPFRFRSGEEGGEPREGRIRVMVGGDSARAWTLEADSLTTLLRGEGPGVDWFRSESDSETFFPFSAYVARSERTDSILEQVEALRARLEEARRAELARQRELAESLEEQQRRIDQTDEELRRTRQLQAEIRARLAQTRERLEQESRRALMARAAELDSVGVRIHGALENAADRIPAPHALGRTVVAGAQLLALNEGLGRYFGTDEGVLVTEVVPGSPAEAAGVEPGDVLVAVAGRPVRAVAEVRRRLGDPRIWPAELTLLRRGERLTVRISR